MTSTPPSRKSLKERLRSRFSTQPPDDEEKCSRLIDKLTHEFLANAHQSHRSQYTWSQLKLSGADDAAVPLLIAHFESEGLTVMYWIGEKSKMGLIFNW